MLLFEVQQFYYMGRTAVTSDFLPKIDIATCIGCEMCVKVCPNKVLALVNNLPKIVHPAACDYSSACQEICPSGAISLTYEIVL